MGMQRGKAILMPIMMVPYGFIISFLFAGAFGLVVLLTSPLNLGDFLEMLIGIPVFFLLAGAAIMILIVMQINIAGEYIKIYNNEKASLWASVTGLRVGFFRKCAGVLWMGLWLLIWFSLLVVPGFMKAFSYYFTPYILAECPSVKPRSALKISMQITKGHRWSIFVFMLSFMGWLVLSAFTFGILTIVYVGPYYFTALAGLYVEMRDEALASGRITRADLGWG